MKKGLLNLSLIVVGVITLYLFGVLYLNSPIKGPGSHQTLGFFGTFFGSAMISYGLINFSNLNKNPKIIWTIVLTIIFTILAAFIEIYLRTGFIW